MQKSNWIPSFFRLLPLAILLLIFGCSGDTKPADRTTDFSVQAGSLYQAFSGNETASNEKYVGKVVEVVGTLKGFSVDAEETLTLALETNDIGAIHCNFPKKDAPAVTKMKAGETIKVKGICSGFLLDVMLDDCLLIQI